MNELFDRFARVTAEAAGSGWAFTLSVVLIVAWAAVGPVFGWSDTWQLIANTGTTIVTFWMVFVLQHAQNSDTASIKVMLEELVVDLKEVDEHRARRRIQEESGG